MVQLQAPSTSQKTRQRISKMTPTRPRATAGAVEIFEIGTGELRADANRDVIISGWSELPLELTAQSGHPHASHFGCALTPTVLERRGLSYPLQAGMYFSSPETVTVRGGRGWAVTMTGPSGFFSIGGPVEGSGRLRYIDGCTDSLLIAPVEKGAPCLNLLCFPSHLEQTRHTHPSLRTGLVLGGRGLCRSRESELELTAGTVFLIPRDTEHAFATREEGMSIVAFHPDSDFGPTDEDHPMINRTVIVEA